MYKVEEVANYFIDKGIKENNPLNPMKLQKMLYYAYGWYYAYFQEKLFNEDIQAWQYGPVIESIYHDVKDYGNYPITAPITKFLFGDGTRTFGFKLGTPKLTPNSENEKAFLDATWTAYSKYNALQLSDATHAEGTPWDTVCKKFNGKIPKGTVIDNELIKKYFLAAKSKPSEEPAK